MTTPTSQALEGLKMAAEPFTEGFDWIDDEPRAPDDATVDADDYDRAITYRDIRRLRQALADLSHVPDGEEGKAIPVDDPTRFFSDSILPREMIDAGAEAYDRAGLDMANYVAGETIDWDSGMIAVAVFRAMCAAAPSPTPQDGWRPDRVAVEQEAMRALQRVLEYDDRTSPEDWPEALLITGEEFHSELMSFADAILSLPSANSGVG